MSDYFPKSYRNGQLDKSAEAEKEEYIIVIVNAIGPWRKRIINGSICPNIAIA